MALSLADIGGLARVPEEESFVEPPEVKEAIVAPKEEVTGLSLQDVQVPEMAEPTSVEKPAPRIGLKDIALGTVETAGGLGYGALSFLPAQLIRHSAIAGQKIQQKLGLVPKMTPEEQAEFGENIAGQIQSLGGLAEPRTISGQASLELISDILQPITDLAHWTAKGVDPEKHPNLHNALATVTEFGIFAAIPTIGKSAKRLAKKVQKVNKLPPAEQAKAQIEVDAAMKSLIEKGEKALAEPDALEKAYTKAEETIGKIEREAVVSGEMDMAARFAEQKAAVARRQGLKAQLERAKIPREPLPEIAPKPIPPRPPVEFKTAQELQAERLPFKSEQGQRLMDRILAPLKNERGEVVIKTETARKNLGESEKTIVRRLGQAASDAKKGLHEFLIEKGMTKEEAKQLEQLYESLRSERPNLNPPKGEMVGGIERPTELYTLREGEPSVNFKRVKEGKVPVGQRWLDAAKAVPRTRTPGLVKGFTTGLTGFKKLGGPFEEIWHRQRDARKIIHEERKVHKEHITDLHKEFGDKKLREEAGTRGIQESKMGQDALDKMGVKAPEGSIQYQGLLDRLEPLFEDLHTRLNETRIAIGKKPIPKMDKYLPFFSKETFYDQIGKTIKGDEFIRDSVNLVTDGLDNIQLRHSDPVMESTNFAHLKRRGLQRGTKLELDPLQMYARYLETSLNHIHNSPINAFIKEFTTKNLKDPKTGKTFNMRNQRPEMAEFLGRWSNSIAGVPNVKLPKFVDRGLRKLSSNLTAATLGWSARTMIVQPTALLQTATEFGYPQMVKGLSDTILRKKVPIDKSRELGPRVHDAFLNDTVSKLSSGLAGKTWGMFQSGALKGMSYIDYVAAEATWRTAFDQAKKKGMDEHRAIRFADDTVVRTQGSGDPGAVSPIQMNALGRAATLWQTFTINNINWLGKEVLGIKNPEATPARTAWRVLRFVAGASMINMLFEEGMGIQSPLPAPIHAIKDGLEAGDSNAMIALNTMLELSEIAPLGSSLKYGSHPLGPVIEYFGEISNVIAGNDVMQKDVIPKALEGDKKSMLKVAELIGTGVGIPGTKQVTKFIRARGRGEPIPAAIVGRFTPKKSRKRKRRQRKRRTRR